MHAASEVTVEHVRLRGAQMDAPAARQRLSYLLSSVAFRPSRISPSAVLVVRSMSDPLPGAIAKQFSSASYASAAWENAAQARLNGLCAEAARPARSVVRSSAEAVLFADYGELLACLAIDCGAGVGLAWWWRSILRHHSARVVGTQSEVWPRVWAEHPLYVPAALQQLDEQRQAVRVLERIAPSQAWRLLLAVARAFGLPATTLIAAHDEAGLAIGNAIGRSPRAFAEIPSDAPTEVGASLARSQSGTPSARARAVHVLAPWEPYVAAGAIPSTLGVERRALLGISLLLHRAALQAASPHFAPRFRSWLAAERAHEAGIDERGATRPPQISLSELRFGAVAKTSGADIEIADAGLDRKSTARNWTESDTAEQAQLSSQAQPISTVSANESTASDLAVHDPVESASAALKTTNVTEPQFQFEDGCHTSLGGIFYLIHLLLRSELLAFDVGLRGWALLELLARCLLHREWQEVADDPIWDALAQLDFRESGTHPGADFTPLETYGAPESWLRGLDATQRYARLRTRGLEVWLAEGFLILDTAAPEAAASHARMTHQQRRAFRKDASVCAAGLDLAPELRRFLHFLLPYVRWRLRRALGGASLTDILRRRGTLYITRSHVDLVMRMREISVPARIAGLDANPGWTPELGRVIKFHFVDDFQERDWSGGR
jgi:hypothetical protein